MSHRHAISDADRARIAHLLPCPPDQPGPVSGDNRWCRSGTWLRLLAALADPDVSRLILDATVIRAHQHAAGAPQLWRPGDQKGQALGYSRAGTEPRFTGRSPG